MEYLTFFIYFIMNMKPEDVLSLPLFPKWELNELLEDTILIESAVYVHLDCGETVEVYLQPVSSEFVVSKKRTKEMAYVEEHLSTCLRVSKYCNMTPGYAKMLPLVATLDKRDKYFLHDLHYEYP